ncbi:MAG: alpha/beta fold hydrolase [Aeromicrobium sp.]|uniref:alpha/beta hydrolase n=1 Tax=Aeromicrobium sp. TaxID=1871063 RepID=UPI0025C51949|nr:alpha/beta fold hydrolase [Aeromicrobium sp.]MCK5890582.1 alpha/beta fold hydrolase [Aeromicrobium sp.]MDF1703449.1 alpha/beta fold hydrolase [Aeromicrobium sp.]
MASPTPASGTGVRPEAAPLSHDGGTLGFLLSHGFTGSPASMVPWGEHLVAQGHSVRVPRLPGHGTTWQDMNRTRWQDWYGTVEAAFLELRERCDHVVVGGLSMGGCLALKLAEQHADAVDAVVVVNPAIASRRKDLKLVPVLQHVLPSMPGIGNDIKRPGTDEYGYDRTPLKALASMTKLWAEVRRDLGQVRAPLLYFRSTDDHVVDSWSRELVLAGISSSVVDDVTLTDSFHVATLDHDAPLIFARTDEFVAQHVSGGTSGGRGA